LELIVDDPTAYTKTWNAKVRQVYVPDVELMEAICENEKDLPHMVGK
jgi:hypothetical protein